MFNALTKSESWRVQYHGRFCPSYGQARGSRPAHRAFSAIDAVAANISRRAPSFGYGAPLPIGPTPGLTLATLRAGATFRCRPRTLPWYSLGNVLGGHRDE